MVVVQSIIPGGTNSLGFPQGTETALGSGFVIDRQGHILTNAHVVVGREQRDRRLLQRDRSGQHLQGEGAGHGQGDRHRGAAAAERARQRHRPAALGSVRTSQVGDPVVAIGNPLGEERTITSGIISAVNRTIDSLQTKPADPGRAADRRRHQPRQLRRAADRRQGKRDRHHQPDPVRRPRTDSGNIGIGFAIPIDTALQVARAADRQRPRRAHLPRHQGHRR